MIKEYLRSFGVLKEEEIDDFVRISSEKNLAKSDYFIRQGENCRDVAFVTKGVLRSFYTSAKGDEISYCITFPNQMITAYSAFISGRLSEENIQAIGPVSLLVTPKSAIDQLVQENPNWNNFLKTMAEQQYIALEKRVFQLQKTGAAERYADMLKNHPEYIQHIPLQYLASFLGITQRHLSRIRKENIF